MWLRSKRYRSWIFLAALIAAASGPALEAKPVLSAEDRKAWMTCLKRVKMKPPCCGACRRITEADLKDLWSYLTSEKENETALAAWDLHKDKLLQEFKLRHPDRFETLYGNH